MVDYSFLTISDDSGLCIDNLNYQPGIYSSRWAKTSYSQAFLKIKEKLKEKKLDINGQPAKFVCVIAMIKKNKKETLYKGTLKGSLVYPPKGKLGFGYDPIFIPKNYNKTLAEMHEELKNSLSHRNKAIKKLINDLQF